MAFRQIMIGFHQDGSTSYDQGLDGKRNENGNNIDFFSIIENDNRRYAIQTQDNFVDSKIIPLGIEIINSGTYKISIDHLEGIFQNGQDILIFDELTQVLHNLSTSDYNFNIDITTDLRNRFSIRFTNNTLYLNGQISMNNSVSIYPNPSKGVFNISMSNFEPSTTYDLTDLSGKPIVSKKLITNNTIDLLHLSKGVYFIKIQTKKNTFIEKLIIK